MVCSLLSEWCVATSFYQSSANYVSFSFCETYSTLSKSGTPAALLFAAIPQPLHPGAQAGFRMSTLSLPETLDLDDIQDCEAFAYSPLPSPQVPPPALPGAF
jgi:hypothetical protein